MSRNQLYNLRLALLVLLLMALTASAVLAFQPAIREVTCTPLVGEEAERFLRSARVIGMEPIPVGVTHPMRVTLSDGQLTARAVWKTVNIFEPVQRFSDGGVELSFRDSYKHEIAAYELDKLLGLDMVPPTVERRLSHDWGSLQLWIEDAITETERRRRHIKTSDVRRRSEQIYTLRLVRQLLDDSDFNNISNVLVAADERIWAIDHSRAFRLGKKLRGPGDLQRFSRSVLAALRDLSPELLEEHLGNWLTKQQIRTLLVRRDLLLERADQLLAEKGEAAVLFP